MDTAKFTWESDDFEVIQGDDDLDDTLLDILLDEFTEDEYTEALHPRDPHGKYTHKGGGSDINAPMQSKGTMLVGYKLSFMHKGKSETVSLDTTKVKGNSGERVLLRAAYKQAIGNDIKKEINNTIVASFKKQHAVLAKTGKNPDKMAEIEGHLKKYGVDVKKELSVTAPTPIAKLKEPEPVPPPAPNAVPTPTPELQKADNWKKIGEQKGSNPGGTYEDASGNKWYVKVPKTEDHVNQDILANKLYREAGINVPVEIKTTLDGKPAVASRIIPDVNTLGELAAGGTIVAAVEAQIQKGFAVDAWLANWDVIGLNKDNILIGGMLSTTGGLTGYRTDTGGTLGYRAQGGTKAFEKEVKELDTLRDPNLNPQAAKVFGKMTYPQIAESIELVKKIPDQTIVDEAAKLGIPHIGKMLVERKKYLAFVQPDFVAGKKPDLKKIPMPTAHGGEDEDEYPITVKTKTKAEAPYKTSPIAGGQPLSPEDDASWRDLVKIGPNASTDWVMRANAGLKKLPSGVNISPYEAAHITAYTGHAFGDTNRGLRSGVMTEELWNHTLRLNDALDKLPNYQGVVGRGATVKPDVIMSYKEGMIIEERAFTSASKGTGWSGNLKLKITSKTGTDVNALSMHPGENEVLFKSGTRFKVTKVSTHANTTHVEMEEIAAASWKKTA